MAHLRALRSEAWLTAAVSFYPGNVGGIKDRLQPRGWAECWVAEGAGDKLLHQRGSQFHSGCCWSWSQGLQMTMRSLRS